MSRFSIVVRHTNCFVNCKNLRLPFKKRKMQFIENTSECIKELCSEFASLKFGLGVNLFVPRFKMWEISCMSVIYLFYLLKKFSFRKFRKTFDKPRKKQNRNHLGSKWIFVPTYPLVRFTLHFFETCFFQHFIEHFTSIRKQHILILFPQKSCNLQHSVFSVFFIFS